MGIIKNIDPMKNISGLGIRVEIELSDGGYELSVTDLVNRVRKFRPYIELNNGGVLFKGDINNQIVFVYECCSLCKKAGINTCVELKYNQYIDRLYLKYIDSIILDINELPLYNNIDKYIEYFSDMDIYIKCNKLFDYKKFNNVKNIIYIE